MNELHADVSQGGKSSKKVINLVDFHLQLSGCLPMRFNYSQVFSHKLIIFWKCVH